LHCDSAQRDEAVRVVDQREAAEVVRRWDAVFRHSSWGVVIVDSVGRRIVAANPALERMHGYDEGEMVGWLGLFVAAWFFGWFSTVVLAFAGLRMLNVLGYSLYSVLFPAVAAALSRRSPACGAAWGRAASPWRP